MMKLQAPLIITNVSALLKQITKQIKPQSTLDINLSEVPNIDSAGIAFLLQLKSIAVDKNCHLSFSNAPDYISRFCQLYQVTL